MSAHWFRTSEARKAEQGDTGSPGFGLRAVYIPSTCVGSLIGKAPPSQGDHVGSTPAQRSNARLAQLEEHCATDAEAEGSSPSVCAICPSTSAEDYLFPKEADVGSNPTSGANAVIAHLDRASPSEGEGGRFDSF